MRTPLSYSFHDMHIKMCHFENKAEAGCIETYRTIPLKHTL